jgi:hypothetical protein
MDRKLLAVDDENCHDGGSVTECSMLDTAVARTLAARTPTTGAIHILPLMYWRRWNRVA